MKLKFVQPFTLICSGPSFSGKTTLVVNIIKNSKLLISPPTFSEIVWCLSEQSSFPESLKGIVKVHKGIPEFTNYGKDDKLIVLDDLMNESSSRQVSDLFTKQSHHRRISVILITQNIFHQSPYARTISLNTKYLIVFKNCRDKSQIIHLARQLYPEDWRGFHKAFLDVSKKPHGYLLIDLCQGTNELLRFRTDILNTICTVYSPVGENNNEAIEIE